MTGRYDLFFVMSSSCGTELLWRWRLPNGKNLLKDSQEHNTRGQKGNKTLTQLFSHYHFFALHLHLTFHFFHPPQPSSHTTSSFSVYFLLTSPHCQKTSTCSSRRLTGGRRPPFSFSLLCPGSLALLMRPVGTKEPDKSVDPSAAYSIFLPIYKSLHAFS